MKPLRIVMTADPEIPVPPRLYGGIERIVAMLVNEFSRQGHDVHLFAHPDSTVGCTRVPYSGARSHDFSDTIRNAAQIRSYVRRLGNVSVVHSFSRLAYLAFLFQSGIPLVQSYQRMITRRSVVLGSLLTGNSIAFVACSKYCAGTVLYKPVRWNIIYNGVPLATFTYQPEVAFDAPLVFLSRIEWFKGAHTAIEVARRAGKRLIIAGNYASSGKEWEYFKNCIEPQCDGENVCYIGPVDDSRKNELLGKAKALLFPVEWNEPFGIVMAEALACGTPVIAFRRGAIPEVVEDGSTGFVCDTIDEMVCSVQKIDTIVRSRCRKSAEEKFSDRVIAEAYSALYRRLKEER